MTRIDELSWSERWQRYAEFNANLRKKREQKTESRPAIYAAQCRAVAADALIHWQNGTGRIGSPAMPGWQQAEDAVEMVADLMAYLATRCDGFNRDAFLRDVAESAVKPC